MGGGVKEEKEGLSSLRERELITRMFNYHSLKRGSCREVAK